MTARDAHFKIGGRRDGSLLVEIDVEPLISQSNNPDALYEAEDLYLLGLAHRRCRTEARRRLIARQVKLPDVLPQLRVSADASRLPALHVPPAFDRCPYCSGAEPTEEHVFAQWLSKELGSIGNLVDRKAAPGPRRLRKIDVTAPICRTCNNRWLSVIENDTKPILARLVRGEEQRLDPAEQKLLATWALKTAMMLDLASGSPVIPMGFFHALRQRREPFESKFIWLAAHSGSSWAAWSQHRPLHIGIDASQPPNGFVTTFNTFRVIFQVVGHFTGGAAEFDDNRVYRDVLAQIWPPRSQSVDSPPQRVAFDDAWLVKLAESITG